MRQALQRFTSEDRGRVLREDIDRLETQIRRAEDEVTQAIELYQDLGDLVRGTDAAVAVAAGREWKPAFEARERAIGKLRKLMSEREEALLRLENWTILRRAR